MEAFHFYGATLPMMGGYDCEMESFASSGINPKKNNVTDQQLYPKPAFDPSLDRGNHPAVEKPGSDCQSVANPSKITKSQAVNTIPVNIDPNILQSWGFRSPALPVNSGSLPPHYGFRKPTLPVNDGHLRPQFQSIIDSRLIAIKPQFAAHYAAQNQRQVHQRLPQYNFQAQAQYWQPPVFPAACNGMGCGCTRTVPRYPLNPNPLQQIPHPPPQISIAQHQPLTPNTPTPKPRRYRQQQPPPSTTTTNTKRGRKNIPIEEYLRLNRDYSTD
ncbi:MAG: hypothetical protein Q9218_007053, partial [Villophora microphyllina]